jgi:Cof subfamily protein (haloacid dehalogenase superfamily)
MSGARRFDLLLSDVDGTLVTHDKVLTEEAKEAARAMRAAGVKLAITSGRPPRGMRMMVEPLAIDTMVAGFNGGVFVNPDMSVVRERPLSPEVAAEAARIIGEAGLDVWLYTRTDWFVLDKDAPHVARETFTVQFEPKIAPRFTDAMMADAVKIVGVSDDYPKVEACETAAQQALGNRASATRSQPYYLDVTHPEANKGAVVHALSEMLKIPRDRIATIGDGANDVLMFRESGFSIAMGNASEAVRRQASAVTATNEENGFAEAVRRFILGNES